MSELTYSRPKEEPCRVCGEETAMGSVYHTERRQGTAPDGSRFFLCSDCVRRLIPHDHQVDINDPEFYKRMVAAGIWGVSQNVGLG